MYLVEGIDNLDIEIACPPGDAMLISEGYLEKQGIVVHSFPEPEDDSLVKV